MSSLKDWNNAIDLVEQVAGGRGVQVNDALAQLETASRSPMSPATWRKMLAKQVPQQLATACVKVIAAALAALSTGNSSTANTTSSSTATATYCCRRCGGHTPAPSASASDVLDESEHNERLYMVLAALCCLADRAGSDLMGTDESKAAAFGQQIHAAGFVQLLPQLLDSLAQRMQDETGLTTAQFTPLRQGSASAGGGGPVDVPAISGLLGGPVLAVLRLCIVLSNAWEPGVFVTEVAPDATHPLLRLCWLTMRYTDSQVQKAYGPHNNEPVDSAQPAQPATLWNAARQASSIVWTPITMQLPGSQAASHEAHVKASPCALPCVAYTTAVSLYALLLAQLPHLPAAGGAAGDTADGASAAAPARTSSASGTGSTTSASGGSSSSRRISAGHAGFADVVTAAWQLASKEAGNVPAFQSMLLRHMGASTTSVLFFAGMLVSDFATEQQGGSNSSGSSSRPAMRVDAAGISRMYAQLQIDITCYQVLAMAVDVKAAEAALGQLPSWRAIPPATVMQGQIHLLMSSLLYYWAAHQPARMRGASTQDADCVAAVVCAGRGLQNLIVLAPQPEPMCQRMEDELAPLIAVVGRTVLRTLGLKPRHTTAGSATSSSSSSSSSQSATATSSLPALTAMSCAQALCVLLMVRSEEHLVLAGHLLEAAARGWQQIKDHTDVANVVALLQIVLSYLIKQGSSSSSSSGGSSRGIVLAAAQTQRPLPTESSSSITPQQLQLASLCFSVLKMLMTIHTANPAVCNTAEALRYCQLVAQAASSMLSWLARCGPILPGTSAVRAQEAVAAAVPWLALSGRVLQFVSTVEWQLPGTTTGASDRRNMLHVALTSVCVGLEDWLRSGGDDALATAGYPPSGSLLQQIMAETVDVTELQSLCCALPFACACNNPACANLAGPAEVQLVGGKTCICSGCYVARYCSRACQVQAWKQQHKPVCRAVAAAVALQ